MSRLEREYQAKLIKKIENLLPGCVILKNNPARRAGIPDLTIFYRKRWGVLETKREARSSKRPNQDWYIDQLNDMSFGAFIYPGNEEEVLDALQAALTSRRTARLSKRL